MGEIWRRREWRWRKAWKGRDENPGFYRGKKEEEFLKNDEAQKAR
jgi:hypothetical protein